MATSVEVDRGSRGRRFAIPKPTRRTWVAIGIFVVVLAVGVPGGFWLAGRSSTSDVKKFLNSYAAAWEAGDGSAVLEHFTPNGVLKPKFGGELKGGQIAALATLGRPGARAVELKGDPIVVEQAGSQFTARHYLVSQRETVRVGGQTWDGIGVLWLVEQDGKLLIEQHQDFAVGQLPPS